MESLKHKSYGRLTIEQEISGRFLKPLFFYCFHAQLGETSDV